MIDLETIADFTWNYHSEFLLETNNGNYIWSDPDYNGNNTIKKYNGTYKEWCEVNNIPFGREKGVHKISEYCGTDVKFI
jgi:hypothetical protein